MSKKETAIIYRENHRLEMKILNDKRVFLNGEYQPVIKQTKPEYLHSYYMRRKNGGDPIIKIKPVPIVIVKKKVISKLDIENQKLHQLNLCIDATSCLSQGYGDLWNRKYALIAKINNPVGSIRRLAFLCKIVLFHPW